MCVCNRRETDKQIGDGDGEVKMYVSSWVRNWNSGFLITWIATPEGCGER